MACSCGTMFVHSIHNQKIVGLNTAHGKYDCLVLSEGLNKSKLVKKFWNNFHSAGYFESPEKNCYIHEAVQERFGLNLLYSLFCKIGHSTALCKLAHK